MQIRITEIPVIREWASMLYEILEVNGLFFTIAMFLICASIILLDEKSSKIILIELTLLWAMLPPSMILLNKIYSLIIPYPGTLTKIFQSFTMLIIIGYFAILITAQFTGEM